MQSEFVLIRLLLTEFSESGVRVFAQRSSVSFDEILRAEQLGFKAKHKLVLNDFEYNGEQVVEMEGKRLAVYRTYNPGGGKIEVYVESKLGI